MTENERKSVQARCQDIGMAVRFVFWAYMVYVIISLGIGCYLMFAESGAFTLNLTETADGLMGAAFFHEGLRIDFAHCIFYESTSAHAKTAYLAAYFNEWFCKVMFGWILYELRNIFRRIEQEKTPFVLKNSRSLLAIGVLIPVISVIRGLCPILLMVMGIVSGSTGNSVIAGDQLLIGGVIVSLSYVFEYGTKLQIESDETL